MSVLPSLCAALRVAGGDRLILREGERPHVFVDGRRQDAARAVLTRTALETIALEVLSENGRHILDEQGTVIEPVQAGGIALTARVERVDQDLHLELRLGGMDDEPERREDSPEAALVPAPPDGSSVREFLLPDSPPVPSPAHPEAGDMPVGDEVHELTLVISADPALHDPVPAYEEADEPRAATITAFPPAWEEITSALPAADHDVAVVRDTTSGAETIAATQAPVTPPDDSPRDLTTWLDRAAARGATALYLRAGQPAAARIDERIEPLGPDRVDVALFDGLTTAFECDTRWRRGSDGEWTRTHERLGEVTCQPFTDHTGSGAVVRFSPPQTAQRLHRQIPRQVRDACHDDGLVVVAAPTGADVLAMASTVADWAGRRRGGYVVTLTSDRAPFQASAGMFVSHRDPGPDVAGAIRRAAAESPDVLLIVLPQAGPAMEDALKAATGARLVVAGIVAPTTVSALRLLASGGTPHADAERLGILARTFRGGFTHCTLRRVGGGLTHVQDLLVPSPAVSALLAKGDFAGVARLQSTGTGGLRSIDQALARAVVRRHLTLRQASAHAANREQFVALVRAARKTPAVRRARPGFSGVGSRLPIDQEPTFAGTGGART